ncbi:MAG: hypothetical protein IPK70_02450 [Flavobacteriales bacterium]|nr:hypothetical protein [Flavobacteriales bacterium]
MEKHLRALRFIMALVVVALAALMAWLLAIDEAAFDAMVDRSFGYGAIPDYPDKLPLPTRISLIWAASSWAAAACIVASWPRLARALCTAVSGAWRCGRAAVARTWASMTMRERWVFALALLACTVMRIAFAVADPPMLDEVLNWLLFGDRGPLVALTWYAAPNNHIGHTLLASITGLLRVDPLLALRAPSIIAAGLAQGALYMLLRRICGPAPALLAVAFAMASPLVLYFDHLGRGYAMVLLAFTMGFGSAALWLKTRDPRALHLLVIAAMLGVFVTPSVLYGFGALLGSLMLFRHERSHVMHAVARAVIGIALLYAPSLIVSGPAAFLDNPWVRPIGYAAMAEAYWPHMKLAFEGLVGFRSGLLSAITVVLLASAFTRNERQRLAVLCASLVALALALPFIHGVLPFERVFVFLIVPLAASIGLLVQRLLTFGAAGWMLLPIALILFAGQTVRLRKALPIAEADAFRADGACWALNSYAPKRIIGQAQPLSSYALFDFKRGGYPAGACFDVIGAGQSPARSGAVFIGSVADFNEPSGDSLLFTDEGTDAIWVISSAPSP